MGKDVVAVAWHGHEYLRAYAVASNPNSEKQKKQRGSFAEAVKAWRELSSSQQKFYRQIADGMTGHNLFVSRFIEAVNDNREPEVPKRIRWVTANGEPVSDGALQIRKGDDNIFYESLKGGEAEIALTRSDGPYTVLLVKGVKEDQVLTVEGREFVENPPPLESSDLGIKLVLAEISAKKASSPMIGSVLGPEPLVAMIDHDPPMNNLSPEIDASSAELLEVDSQMTQPPSG